MTAPREVNAERAMHLRRALEDIVEGRGRFSHDRFEHACNTIEDMKAVARDAIRDDDVTIEIAEQDAGHCDPEE